MTRNVICARLILFTFALIGQRANVLGVSVCLSVCVNASTSLKPQTLRNFTNFCCSYCPWPWLGPPLPALRYVMYFRFCGWRHNDNGVYSKCFARWQQRRELVSIYWRQHVEDQSGIESDLYLWLQATLCQMSKSLPRCGVLSPIAVKPALLDNSRTWLWVSSYAEYPLIHFLYFTLCLNGT